MLNFKHMRNNSDSPASSDDNIVDSRSKTPESNDLKDTSSGAKKTAPELGEVSAETTPSVEAEAPAEPEAKDVALDSTNLEDTATSQAVDDIAETDSDTLLAIEDASVKPPKRNVPGGFKAKLRRVLKNKWTWIAVAGVVVLIFAVPFTRYKVLGLVVKKPVTFNVVDSKTATPVSAATITINGRTVKTDGNGKVTVKIKVGSSKATIAKQYYRSTSADVFVGLKAAPATKINLAATGRPVAISVVNSISGKPLANAEIKVLNTTAKTDAKGRATLVVPADLPTAKATITASGYNQQEAKLTIADKTTATNAFRLTPSGQIYFLSNSNGTIDVVKANLDGTGRQIVLAGTGKEDASGTNLLATRDWKYLVLHARRDSAKPELYLIDTTTGKVTDFEQGDATFHLVGWSGHNFVYYVERNNVSYWQAGHIAVKSYNAENGQLNQLDQTQGQNDQVGAVYQTFDNFYITADGIVYTSRWFGNYNGNLSGKTNTVKSIQAAGTNKKESSIGYSDETTYIQGALNKPQEVYYQVFSKDNTKTYYEYENQSINKVSNLSDNDFTKSYPTYLVSPAGDQTFWTELRDGKNALFVGDKNAGAAKQIASLDGYTPYGWYSDSYVLVSKDSDELYIMPASGLAAGQEPLKVSSYYKPASNFNGYGYGYGGL
jgi:hypothetical protein